MKIKIFFQFLLCSTFFYTGCSSDYYITDYGESSIQIDSNIVAHAPSEQLILPFRELIGDSMKTVLCESEKALYKGRPESELGNLVADLSLYVSKQLRAEKAGEIDFCMMNTGGLRSSLPEGEITIGNVFQLMPFENELVVVTIHGKGMENLFDYLKESGGEPIAGLRVNYFADGYEATINGKKFDASKTYRVLTSDYLANGGDRMNFFTENERLDIEKLNLKLRDAIEIYFDWQGRAGTKLNPKIDGRLQLED